MTMDIVFESSIDILIGNVLKGVKKDGQSIEIINSNSSGSCQLINFFLVLIRYHFSYSNSFYKINKSICLIMSIYSIISILLTIFIYRTFELLFKLESFIINSYNIYSYLLILSLIISILFILLTNHALFYYYTVCYFQQEYYQSNQLIRLSNLNDRYLIEKSIRRSLIYYLLFVILCLICQFPFLIFIFKLFYSGLIDYLFIIYIIFLLLYLFISIIFLFFLCLFRSSSSNFNYLNKFTNYNKSISSHCLYRSNENVKEKFFTIGTSHLIPRESVSSCGLTIIDHENSNRTNSHSTFKQTERLATDAFLVMH
ncbi:unnamed protein product [Rotaria sordida]|uniref:Uncharacterized protein n=2 Tax=Rotaria sordida TaxID=392033 RepID=A0A820C9L6_9BILA|nr:unnamed protein product [Rotaria sordida]